MTAAEAIKRRLCRCGCEGEAIAVVDTPDYDPAHPNGKPAPHEPVCGTALDYLRESAAELGHSFRLVRWL